MSKTIKFLSGLAVLMIAVTLSGCTAADDHSHDDDDDKGHVHGEDCDHEHDADDGDGAGADDDGDDDDGADDDGDDDDGDDDDGDDDDGDDDDQAETEKEKMLEGLSAEEQAAVEKQQTCPVSDALLWSMAKPYKITLADSDGNSRELFLCCEGCEAKAKADPDKYLAKLGK